MRKQILWIAVAAALAGLIAGDVLAQRGRGGGGGARPSVNRAPSMSRGMSTNRSPSMSRPSLNLPSMGQPSVGRPSFSQPGLGIGSPSSRPGTPSFRPGAGGGATQRPSSGQLQDFLHLPSGPGGGAGPAQLPAGLDRNTISGAISNRYPNAGQRPFMPDWFQPGASQLPIGPGGPVTPGERSARDALARAEGERPDRLPGAGGDRPIVPPDVRPPGPHPPGPHPPGPHPPGPHPVIHHPPAWHPWYRPGHYYPPGFWWRPVTPVAVTGWFVGWWTQPVYYTYGSGGNVYYENNVVYVNGEQYGTAEQYYQDTSKLAASVPEVTDAQAETMEWMPLGVFAVTHGDVNDTSMLLQLAVNKEGVIAGTFYNESTEAGHPVEGMVDQKTQRAAWKVADGTNENVVMETGIYNLTQDEVPVLVHFGPDTTQTWTLVRVEQPEEAKTK